MSALKKTQAHKAIETLGKNGKENVFSEHENYFLYVINLEILGGRGDGTRSKFRKIISRCPRATRRHI